MNTVITVNLGGNAYQLDEAGYAKLRAYLDTAHKNLEGNPDRAEIITDLESAIGEKCRIALGSQKTVVEEKDIEAILLEMGPVEGGEGAGETRSNTSGTEENKTNPKRLFRVQEGAMLAGVCNGLAAYFNIDVTLVRILFVVLTFVTSGAFAGVYVVMMFIIPRADTAAQRSAAYGMPPITAQELINRAKDGYSNVKNSKEWREWKHNMRQWKQERKHHNHQYKHHYKTQAQYAGYKYNAHGHRPNAIGELFGLAVLGFLLWLGYHHVAVIHNFLSSIPYYLDTTIQWLRTEFTK